MLERFLYRLGLGLRHGALDQGTAVDVDLHS
jgi:hypothetical protein